MSTKSTIVHGKNFHLYHEALESEAVYLELEGTQFEATPGSVTVRIPVEIWEVIRQSPGLDLDLVGKTDEELEALARSYIDKRLADFERFRRDHPGKRSEIFNLLGSFSYGTVDSPYEEQLRQGMETLRGERELQNRVHSFVETITHAL